MATMRPFAIGRAPDSDLVVNHAFVSARHATMHRTASGAVVLKDAGSSNGTFLQSARHAITARELREDDLILFSEDYKIPGSVLLHKYAAWEQSNGTLRSAVAMGQVKQVRKTVATLGSASDNDVVLPYLSVQPHHARISQSPQGLLVEDLGGGCVLNGMPISRGPVPFKSSDRLEIGGVAVSASHDGGNVLLIGAERRGVYLTAKDLTYEVRNHGATRTLLDKVSFSVMPGELVGLMGPSGCGKTSLLLRLSGAVKGEGVYYNGELAHAGGTTAFNMIGYVPQDDLLFPELTVRETLFQAARLRMDSRTSNKRIREKIDEVCHMLGLVDPRSGLDLRDTLIGSPERKTLSGGQKKRVNLAIELLTDPLILFLDEPTSGLSSHDTQVVMNCLRRLADEKGIPIIITIHQPSLRVYQLFDQTLFLKSGKLAWYGPAYPDSVKHFVQRPKDGDGPDEVMEVVDETDAQTLRTNFERAPYAARFVRQREHLVVSLMRGGTLAKVQPQKPLGRLRQFFLLWKRQNVRRVRDWMSLFIQLGQAPLLGALVGVAFEDARRNTPLFLMAFIAIWFGANGTSRELVAERVQFRREKRCGVSPASTLLAKIAGHGLVLVAQCLLLLVAAKAVLELDLDVLVGGAVLTCGALCGAALGFVIGSLSKTELAATATTPLVLVPLILFGGLLAPYDEMKQPVKTVCEVMPTRWTYEALVHAEKLNYREKSNERNDQIGLMRFQEFSQKDGQPSNSRREESIMLCMGVLLLLTTTLTVVAWLRLAQLH